MKYLILVRDENDGREYNAQIEAPSKTVAIREIKDHYAYEMDTIEDCITIVSIQKVPTYRAVDEDGNPTLDNSQGLQDLVRDLNERG